jgi:hypothetical protein
MTNTVSTQDNTQKQTKPTTGHYLLKKVVVSPYCENIWDFYTRFQEGEIAVLPEWLQRLEQKKKWQRNKGKKCLEYLHSFFTGNSELTPFYIVDVNILIKDVQSRLTRNLGVTEKKIYEDMLKTLEEKRLQGVKYILLDGQNRLVQALSKFFKGTLTSNIYTEDFLTYDVNSNGEISKDEKGNLAINELNNFRFTDLDLPEKTKQQFKNTKALIAEGTDGYVESYIDSIIAMNNGEPWTDFEGVIIKHKPLSYKLNQLIFHNPIIQSLFGNDEISGNVQGMSGTYEIEKKGDARFISESILLIGNNCNSGYGSESELVNMINDSSEEHLKAFEKVERYLTFISNTMNCLLNKKLKEKEKPLDKENLRGLILLLDVMLNKQNVANTNCVFNLNSVNDLKMPKTIFEQFIKWHNEKTDQYATPSDFQDGEPLPGTYVISTRGLRIKHVTARLQFINNFLADNYKSWISKGYVEQNNDDYKRYKEYLLHKSNYKDIYAKGNHDFNLRSRKSTDHTIAVRGPGQGTNNVENLVITNALSNSIKSNKY